jgi:thiol-disulfide isomerase/thioredoxin
MRKLLVLVTLVAAMATACTSSGDDHPVRPTPAVNATSAPLLPMTTTELPDVTSDDFTQLLSQLRGTPVVVNVWGSWCGPCREEGPHLAAAADEFGRRVQFIGLDVRDDRGPAQDFIRQMGWPYPSVFDPSPYATIETDLGYRAQPVTLFFDRDGKLAGQITGPGDATTLEAEIRKILG